MRNAFRFVPAIILLAALNALAGGWATVTVRHIPDYFLAGKVAQFNFIVRQHGVTPLDGVTPQIQAAASDGRTIAGAVTAAGNRKGEFTARITLPEAGDWTIRIASGWNTSAATLLPVNAIAVGSAPPAALSDVARGERLFVSKACVTCHVNHEVGDRNLLPVGPELTGRTFPKEYLQKLLADPASVGKDMPDQELANPEIQALIAFMNRKR